jgi:hypothetical protein
MERREYFDVSRLSDQSSESSSEPSLDAAKKRRARREILGAKAIERYLTISDSDDARTRELKKKISGLGLADTLEQLLLDRSVIDINETLRTLGIKHSEQSAPDATKKPVIRWRLCLPGEEYDKLPGVFIKEQHLKAFLVGFAKSNEISEKINIIAEIYEYLGLTFPKGLEDLTKPSIFSEIEAGATTTETIIPTSTDEEIFEEEQGSEVTPLQEAKVEGPAENELAKVVVKEPAIQEVTDPRWKKILWRLGRRTILPLVIGLASLFPGNPDRAEATTEEGDQIVLVNEPQTEIGSESAPFYSIEPSELGPQFEVKSDTYILQKGETVAEVVRRLLGEQANDREFFRSVVKSVLLTNDIADASYGVPDGALDSTRLPIGLELNISKVNEALD